MISASSDVIADWRECDVDADGVNIHVHRAGRPDRPPLVLAHGLSDSGRCWWRVAQAFKNDFDIVMIEARDHGQSGTAGGGGAPPTADVAAVVAQLGLDRPTLIGHSVGARTVADFAATRPGAAARLVLIGPPWKANEESDGGASDSRREAVRSWLVSCAEATTIELEARAREQHATLAVRGVSDLDRVEAAGAIGGCRHGGPERLGRNRCRDRLPDVARAR